MRRCVPRCARPQERRRSSARDRTTASPRRRPGHGRRRGEAGGRLDGHRVAGRQPQLAREPRGPGGRHPGHRPAGLRAQPSGAQPHDPPHGVGGRGDPRVGRPPVRGSVLRAADARRERGAVGARASAGPDDRADRERGGPRGALPRRRPRGWGDPRGPARGRPAASTARPRPDAGGGQRPPARREHGQLRRFPEPGGCPGGRQPSGRDRPPVDRDHLRDTRPRLRARPPRRLPRCAEGGRASADPALEAPGGFSPAMAEEAMRALLRPAAGPRRGLRGLRFDGRWRCCGSSRRPGAGSRRTSPSSASTIPRSRSSAGPTLSTIRQPIEAMGREMVRLLLHQIDASGRSGTAGHLRDRARRPGIERRPGCSGAGDRPGERGRGPGTEVGVVSRLGRWDVGRGRRAGGRPCRRRRCAGGGWPSRSLPRHRALP